MSTFGPLASLRRATSRARADQLTIDGAVALLRFNWGTPEARPLIDSIEGRALGITEADKVLTATMELARLDARSKQRSTDDTRLGRLACIVGPGFDRGEIGLWLRHRRKSRRKAAYRWLRRNEATPAEASALAEAAMVLGDHEAAELLVRWPNARVGVGAAELISALQEEYWIARLLSSLPVSEAVELASGDVRLLALASVLRGDGELLDVLRSCFAGHDAEFLRRFVRVAGRFGEGGDIDRVESALLKLEETL